MLPNIRIPSLNISGSDYPPQPYQMGQSAPHHTPLIDGMASWNCLTVFDCREKHAVWESIQDLFSLVLLMLRLGLFWVSFVTES